MTSPFRITFLSEITKSRSSSRETREKARHQHYESPRALRNNNNRLLHVSFNCSARAKCHRCNFLVSPDDRTKKKRAAEAAAHTHVLAAAAAVVLKSGRGNLPASSAAALSFMYSLSFKILPSTVLQVVRVYSYRTSLARITTCASRVKSQVRLLFFELLLPLVYKVVVYNG